MRVHSLRHQLREMNLEGNHIQFLPKHFTRLRKLELSANALHELPRAFSRLASLRKPAG